jgi:uncharacterized MAPEG superfamily protein
MNVSLWCLLGFAAWTLLLLLGLISYRSAQVLAGKRRANTWGRHLPSQDPEAVQRLAHAHANCLENLPLFAAVVLVAGLTAQLPRVDSLAVPYLALRICQSTVHLIGTSHTLVFLRFSFFLPQVLLLLWMMGRLANVF